MSDPIITRMAPSPTGRLHIGTARTALFNYLFAKQRGGTLLLRIEDTDKARSTHEFETDIIHGLQWLGLTWDNADNTYRQSEQTNRYTTLLEDAINSGAAYLSKEDSKARPGEQVEVVRLKNPNKTITFTDLIRGDISFDTTELGDIVIARTINDPLYHFAVVADDFAMNVSHVIRGDDHISNTPRQILIQEAIGAPRPQYAHLPLILAPDRSKLSKRHGAVALDAYRQEGFLPEATVNYLALLGWNPGTDQEIFTLPELVTAFSLEQVQKGGAVFDRQKFLWINKNHLENVPDETVLTEVLSRLPERLTQTPQFAENVPKLLPEMRSRMAVYSDVAAAAEAGEYDFAFLPISYPVELLQWKKDPTLDAVVPRLRAVLGILQAADFSSPEHIKAAVWPYAEEVGKGEVLWPLRVALTGRERSPDPFTCAYVLGRTKTLERLQEACARIESP